MPATIHAESGRAADKLARKTVHARLEMASERPRGVLAQKRPRPIVQAAPLRQLLFDTAFHAKPMRAHLHQRGKRLRICFRTASPSALYGFRDHPARLAWCELRRSAILVTPLIPKNTTRPRMCDAKALSTIAPRTRMHEASPDTKVQPNFITCQYSCA